MVELGLRQFPYIKFLSLLSINPQALRLNDTEVYFLFFLVFSIVFMLILGLLLCFYCKKKMWERERWIEIMQSSEGNISKQREKYSTAVREIF